MLCSSYGVGKEWDECFSIDFPGTEYDDVILLKQMRGPFAQKGNLKKEPKTIVYALKDSLFSRKIQVRRKTLFVSDHNITLLAIDYMIIIIKLVFSS